MKLKVFQLIGRFMLSMSLLLLIGCASKRVMIPYNQSQSKQNVSVGLEVNDKANFSFTISTVDPVVLRTFIMQGFSLDIKGKYRYSVKIPCAKDVEKSISHHPGEVKATLQGENEKRPDIRPVLEALNKLDVFIYADGKKEGKARKFNVSIDRSTGRLSYSIVLPDNYRMDMPVYVALISRKEIEKDEFLPDHFPDRNKSSRPQPFGIGRPFQHGDPQKNLEICYKFDTPVPSHQRLDF